MSFLTWFGESYRELRNEIKEVIFTHESYTTTTDIDKQMYTCKPIMKNLKEVVS